MMERNDGCLKVAFMVALVFVFVFNASAQQEAKDVRKGNRLYNKGNFSEAEVEYRRGFEKNDKSFQSNYNTGNTLFRQEKFEDAAKQFEKSLTLAGDDKVRKAACYHNMGNSLLKAGQIEGAINSYKQALRLMPKDDDTRYNLAFAQRLLQQQNQQQQNQQQQEQQDQQQQDQQQQQNQDQQQEQQGEQQEAKRANPQDMSKEQAQQLLDMIEQDEKETQEKVKEQQVKTAKRSKVEKDW